MKSAVFAFLFALGVCITPSFVLAASSSQTNIRVTVNGKTIEQSVTKSGFSSIEQIRSYETDAVIQKDGSVSFTERIVYDFPDARHGIFRYIPYIKTNDAGKRLKLVFKNIHVTDEQKNPYTFTTDYVDDDLVLKIGDPDITITGEHTYVISYDAVGALTYFSEHDELYWNVVGSQWKIPSLNSVATITLPQGIAKKDIHTDCFVGTVGSTLKFCTAVVNGSTIVFQATRPLAAYEAMTIVVGFPKGNVAEVNPTEIIPFFDTFEGKVLLVILLSLAIFWYGFMPCFVVWKWWKTGRDPKPLIGQAVAWYSPPKTKKGRDLTPAETGTLIDETVGLEDIYGSLVDLARRGYFKIIETSKDTFDVEKTKEWTKDSLLPFETKLLDLLFGKKDRVKLKDVKLYDALPDLNSLIYNNLVDEGFFPTNPQTIRNTYVALAVFSLFTLNPILFITALIFGTHMPKKTLYGAEEAAKAKALLSFLKSQDKHLAFQAKEKFMFEKLLPYAIAFGVEVIWAKRFKDMNISTPDWYVSQSTSHHFSSVVFANSLHSGYSASFTQSVSYKSSSGYRSGFSSSGGGFSGGGGGGGGGGSW